MGMSALRPLPPNTAPSGTRCIQITIPDDDEWERDLYSVITELGQWPRWARDEAHSATLVARRWRAALRTFRYCDGTPSQINDEFEEDMNLCDTVRYHNGKLQIMCCGEWEDVPGTDTSDGPGEGQPPPAGRPGPGESGCYNVKLNAAGQWLLPFGVSENDVITITAASGGWTDGSGGWFCPTGDVYAGSACLPNCAHEGGDPSGTACHMELIGVYIDGTNFALSDSPITVPAGFAGVQVTFQANDGTPADNAGDITFNVCVQNNSSLPEAPWCHVIDFTVSDHGFTPYPEGWAPGGLAAHYVPGEGWGSVDNGASLSGVEIQSPSFAAAELLSVEAFYVTDSNYGSTGARIVTTNTNTNVYGALDGGAGTFDTLITNDVTGVLRVMVFVTRDNAPVSDNYRITKLILRGRGASPFGADNC